MAKGSQAGKSIATQTVARAYSATAKAGNGQVPRGSFASGVAKLGAQHTSAPVKGK